MTDGKTQSPFTVLESSTAWSCPWYAVRKDQLRLPDGSNGEYNVVTKCDAVWIVPVTPSGEIVLIHNYRHTLGAWCWELPAGGIKSGQTPLEAAQDELQEEIGGVTGDWQLLLKSATMNGLGDEIGYFFLAKGVMLGGVHHEPTEVMTVHTLPAAEVFAMARSGLVNDSQSIAALLLVEPLLG